MTVADWNSFYRAMCKQHLSCNQGPGQALAYAHFTQVKVQLSKGSVLLPSSECIAIHWQVYDKPHKKRELKKIDI